MRTTPLINEIKEALKGKTSMIALCINSQVVQYRAYQNYPIKEVFREIKEMAQDNRKAVDKVLGAELTDKIINYK